MHLELKKIDEIKTLNIIDAIEKRIENINKLSNIKSLSDQEFLSTINEFYKLISYDIIRDAEQIFLPEETEICTLLTNIFNYYADACGYYYVGLRVVCSSEFYNYISTRYNKVLTFDEIEQYVREQKIIVIGIKNSGCRVSDYDLDNNPNYLRRESVHFKLKPYKTSTLMYSRDYPYIHAANAWNSKWVPNYRIEENYTNQNRLYNLMLWNVNLDNLGLYEKFLISFFKRIITEEKIETDIQDAIRDIKNIIEWYSPSSEKDKEKIRTLSEDIIKIESKDKRKLALKDLEIISSNDVSLYINSLYDFCNFADKYYYFYIVYNDFIHKFYRKRNTHYSEQEYFFNYRTEIEEEIRGRIKDDIPVIIETLKKALLAVKDDYNCKSYSILSRTLDNCDLEEPYILRKTSPKNVSAQL